MNADKRGLLIFSASLRLCVEFLIFARGSKPSALPEHGAQIREVALRAPERGPGVGLGVAVLPQKVVRRNLLEKAARLADDDFAAAAAVCREREGQGLLRAGDADVGQPALLLDVTLGEARVMRQQALLHAENEDMPELEALCRLQRHERDVVTGVVLAVFLEHADEGEPRHQVAQPRLVAFLARQPLY